MPEEIKQVVTVDAAEAIRKLNELTGVEHKLAGGADDAAEAVKKQSDQMSKGEATVRSFGQKIADAAKESLNFGNAIAFAVRMIQDLIEAEEKRRRAMKERADQRRQVAVNIGGERTEQLDKPMKALATEMGFGKEESAWLWQQAATLTDVQPGQTNEQIMATMRTVARFRQATVGKGDVKTLRMLESRLGLSEQKAADAGTALLNGVFDDPALLQQTLQQMGKDRGGIDFLALLAASKTKGLDVDLARKQLPTLLGALGAHDEKGRLALPLSRSGITEATGYGDRVRLLLEARASGKISQAQLEAGMGGATPTAIFSGPMGEAIAGGGVGRAKEEITAEGNVAKAIEEQSKVGGMKERGQVGRDERIKTEAAEEGLWEWQVRARANLQRDLGGDLGSHVDEPQPGVPGERGSRGAAGPAVVQNIREQHFYAVNPATDVRVPENP